MAECELNCWSLIFILSCYSKEQLRVAIQKANAAVIDQQYNLEPELRTVCKYWCEIGVQVC